MFTLLQDERGSGFYFWATAASNVPGQNERTNLNQHNGEHIQCKPGTWCNRKNGHPYTHDDEHPTA
jgi:hypothetical protein